jgi:hypothetical protein
MLAHCQKMVNIARWVVPLAMFALSGCATEFDLSKSVPWEMGKDGKFETPMQVAVFWTDAVQSQAEKPKGIRGFGGRLYFYGKDPNKPVKVKGNLVVYAFDETNRDPKNVVPDKKYVFTPEQFQKKYSKSTLGDSYSIWLPWDEVGGPQKQVSLVVRFTGEKGEMITSDEAKQLLPGATTQEKKVAAVDSNSITMGGQTVALPVVPPMPFGTNPAGAGGVQPAAYASGVDLTGGPKTFSVMQASTGAAVSQATSGQPQVQNQVVQENYGGDPTVPHMKTTTISVPQVPRQRFSSPGLDNDVSGMNSPSGYASGMQSQMSAMGQLPMQNQAPMQNQMQNQMSAQAQIAMLQQQLQAAARNQQQMNQKQLFPAQTSMQQMPSANQNFAGSNGANFTGQTGFTGQSAPVQAFPGQAVPGMTGAAPATPAMMNSQMMQNLQAPNSAAATNPAAQAGTPTANAARSEFGKLQALGAPIARLDSDRGQWPLSRGEQPSNLPSAPQSAPLQ